MTLTKRPRTGPFIATLLAGATLAGCDSTATIYVTSAQFSQLQIVGSYPGRKQANGSWERMCGTGTADGLITNVVFQSTQRRDSSGADLDLSIRPLDVIQTRVVDGSSSDDINLSNPGNMRLDLGCINPVTTTGSTCNGAVASATLDRVAYEANTPDRAASHNVMVLIDQSGSITGLVQGIPTWVITGSQVNDQVTFDRPHQLQVGDTVAISDLTGGAGASAGVYSVSSVVDADTVTFQGFAFTTDITAGRARPEVAAAHPPFREARDVPQLPPNFLEVASDRNNLRLSVAKRLLRTLNADDRPGVLAFGETNGLSVPCSLSVQDVQTDLNACFGARNRDIWFDSNKGIDGLVGKTGGRSNLWLGVKTAYDFLRSKNDRQRSNHIIVLTDGPDTCAGESRSSCQTPCTTADFAALSDQIEADHADPNAPKIHVHFVQFESLGYPGRDARQVELSCVSGGHYQFINSNQFPRVQTQTFQDALDRAVTNVRYSLMGHWALASSVPTYALNAGGGAGVPPGNLYGLEGQLVIKREANLTASGLELTFPFGYGISPNQGESIPNWDRRPTVRKPCGGFADCGAGGAPGACQTVCSPETLVCANGATPVQMPDLALCSPSQGVSGFCCSGTCQTAGQCAACSN